MNIQGNIQQKSRKRSRWIIYIVYMILIMATEPFYRKPLFEASTSYIEWIQGSNPEKNVLLKIAELFSVLGNTAAFAPIILVVYNWANIYKSYVLLMTLLIATLKISALKMIYISPRPYWVSQKIIPFGCEGGWGNPSGHSLASTAFYLTLWHIIFECNQLRNKKILKNISLVGTIIFILLIMFSRNFVGAHSLNQIFYGSLLGFGIYFLLFHVLCIRVNDSQQFYQLLEFRNLIYVVVNFFICLFVFLVYFFNNEQEELIKWDNVINKTICYTIPTNKRLQNEGFLTFAVFMANFGAFMGVKFEYYFTFGENLQNWRQYNFEIDEREEDESLMTKITINKETQWNHTNTLYSIMRFVILVLLSALICIPYMIVDWDDSIALVFIFKILFPLNSFTFSLFFLFKIIFKNIRMVNLTLYSILQDSI